MIRTRFAPSPTGFMHIGNLRTALYSYLIAKKYNGKFILRIEDTDQKRLVKNSKKIIFETLKQAGIKHDEGPDIAGDYGPYIQSERKEIYLNFAHELINKKKAFYCFCENFNKEKKCDCEFLNDSQIKNNIESGKKYVIRQKIFDGTTEFDDLVFGHIVINNNELDKQVLIKSNGLATYNFANVIDDHLMNITHVVRGCEYLSSTPKYNLLYKSFNWQIPEYIHLPLILDKDGKKLSKRNSSVSFFDLIQEGFLPKTIINYIALLGWSPDDNTQELFYLNDLEKKFDIKKISKSPAIFDIKKMIWMNSQHIKLMPKEIFFEHVIPYIKANFKNKNIDLKNIAELSQTRINFIKEASNLFNFLNYLDPNYKTKLFEREKLKSDLNTSESVLKKILDNFNFINKNDWKEENIKQNLLELTKELNFKTGQIYWPLRIALSGQESTPCGAIEIALMLEKDETINRIKFALLKLSNNKQC